MSKFDDHPTVRQYREQSTIDDSTIASPLDADWLRSLCLELGADDVGFVEIDRPEIAAQRQDILVAFPPTKTLVSFVCRMNRENVRSSERSLANVEFHTTGDEVNQISHEIVATLEQKGIRALNPAMGFPMEMDRFPGKIWVVSHKPVAVAAGLGHMGIHRNVIHPKFGNFILLGTILIEAEVTKYNRPIDYNPCLECKLCVVACPVGAIGGDGHFNFSACYTHNYREFLGGFTDWVEDIAESKSAHDYRQKVNDSESASMWQSLAFKSNYKAAYCVAACPAGEDVIGQFLRNKKGFVKEVVQPLQDKEETIYVVPGSDAQDYVARRFPHKKVKQVSNSLRPNSIQGFLSGLPLVFQRNQSVGLDAIYHFTFTGKEQCQATVIIKDKTIQVENSHIGTANIHISADSYTWLQFLAKEQNIVWALIRRKIRVRGSLRLLQAFGKCFP
ncbi:MAG: SCP2 sterol-binding domain-containing protein [Nostoc sp. EfeVER01]|uniref:SCP2 sterol-binding domain-containing protein n=1 Tax=unclassified Nostoc TaxID=2593658 RepID=UPI002AD28470|nr:MULTISPECIES: SCP2 sterol-binding domain-containing protein [unclassified Nostoc]MDZ7948348.1 SCP2 sterol-binding domain-containing protein [Nostoc sp. EfeVER01]MDZ7995325.1 SCP2 sterol-binding domain-containing protein [Nostoc sp. EspVER01]